MRTEFVRKTERALQSPYFLQVLRRKSYPRSHTPALRERKQRALVTLWELVLPGGKCHTLLHWLQRGVAGPLAAVRCVEGSQMEDAGEQAWAWAWATGS